jgi:Putative Actinobacterial Holin-X, holin superfamily III
LRRSWTGGATRTPASEADTAAPERLGVSGAARQVAEQASALARLELELASLELKRKAAALGVGVGLGLGAAIFGFLLLGFIFATIAAALDTFLSTWLSLLIVTVLLLAITGILGMLALRSIKRGTPPVPEQAIEEARRTTDALKHDGNP